MDLDTTVTIIFAVMAAVSLIAMKITERRCW